MNTAFRYHLLRRLCACGLWPQRLLSPTPARIPPPSEQRLAASAAKAGAANANVVGQAIEKRDGQSFRAEHRRPSFEGTV